MEQRISYEYNMENACIEFCYAGRAKIAIDTIGIENQFAESRFQRSELVFGSGINRQMSWLKIANSGLDWLSVPGEHTGLADSK